MEFGRVLRGVFGLPWVNLSGGCDMASKTIIKCAVKTHSDGVTVGWDFADRLFLFASRDYDGKGTVSGPVLDVTDICVSLGVGDKDAGFYKLYL